MVTLTVDRMHTRYVGDAVRYRDCLRRVVDGELERALAAVELPAGHVCVRRLTVPVRLEPSGGAARSWADQLAAALSLAVRDGSEVVGYPRTVDAVVDLLVSLGRADLRRAWAWRQLGLVGSDVGGPDAAVAALAGRPELACAALTAAAARGPLPLTAAGWVTVARRVGELAGAPAAEGPLPGMAVLDSPVGRQLPAGVHPLPGVDRRAVGRLLLLCAAPALARSGPAVAAVAELLGRRRPVPVGGAPVELAIPGAAPAAAPTGQDRAPSEADRAPAGADLRGPGSDHPHPAGSSGLTGREGEDRPTVADPVAAAAGPCGATPAAAVSPAGGVLFLLPATGTPDLPAASPPPLARHPAGPLAGRPLSTVTGWLAARLGEVGPDDPAVHVLAGQPREPLGEPTSAEDAALGLLAEEVRAWLRELLRLQPDDDLRWLWRRPAGIAAEPGWVEATFALDDVDTRVRAAGLDLDPGFVWWLGAVVGYRYV